MNRFVLFFVFIFIFDRIKKKGLFFFYYAIIFVRLYPRKDFEFNWQWISNAPHRHHVFHFLRIYYLKTTRPCWKLSILVGTIFKWNSIVLAINREQETLSGLRPLSEQYNIKGIQANDKQTPQKNTGGNFDSMNIYYVFGTKSQKSQK